MKIQRALFFLTLVFALYSQVDAATRKKSKKEETVEVVGATKEADVKKNDISDMGARKLEKMK